MFADHQDGKGLYKEKIKWDKLALQKTLWRVFRYSGVRVISILLTVGAGLYLTLMIINLGGYVDEIMRGQITQMMLGMGRAGYFDDVPEEELDEFVAQIEWEMEEAMGLHEPMPIRTARWWFKGITLQWGEAERLRSLDNKSNLVKDVIFSRLPYTLLLVGAANIFLFFGSVWVAMVLSTQQGKFWDRLLASLTPISSAPSWVHGVILLAIFALELRILPFKGMFDGAPPETTLAYIAQIAKHMILPVTAIVLSVFFQGVYTWRTFFMVHSGEDYVDLAKAKGLPNRVIRQRYLLRPTLPSIITSFALMLMSFWEGAIALELLFGWPGLGAIFYRAIYAFDRPVVVAIVVMFSYLLGFTVILLDVVYALIDPRVRLGGNGASARMHTARKKPFRRIKRSLSYFWAWVDRKIFRRKRGTICEDTRPVRISHEGLPNLIEMREDCESNALPHVEDTQPGNAAAVEPHSKQGIPSEKTKSVKIDPPREKYIKTLFQKVKANIFKYPMAGVGLVIILILLIIAIGTVIFIPYDQAVKYWHDEGLLLTPRLARPVWVNYFRKDKLPESIYFDSTSVTENVVFLEEQVPLDETLTDIRMSFYFDYTADNFPEDLVVSFDTVYDRKPPFASIILITPDSREIELESVKATDRLVYTLSWENPALPGSGTALTPVEKVFRDPESDQLKPLKGQYQLKILAVIFEEDSVVDVKGVLHGKVYGLFGTDNQRRDLTIAMLWGTPVALSFGIVGAVVTTVTTIMIAAFSAWYGGTLDEILQRITELNITLPALPIAVLVYILYSKSIWVILAVMILMNIFGHSLKEYRAMFLQFKEAPYIEAAMAYGATNRRIIFTYMLPRIIQVMIPQLVISVPGFVFLEATLAYLGVVTPYLPTWGKVIDKALHHGAFWGVYFWVLEPIVLVMITGLAFAFVGFALDKILNPRLRSQ